jgi:predicted signal transduction protein with EAL and GGDEF domain
MRPPDVVARLGGDEFVILVEGRYYTENTNMIAERVQRQLSVPFDLSGQEIYSTASIGILHANDKYKSPEEVMRDADTAMYHAKRSGKARHEIFHENMHTLARETLQLETDLRRAIEGNELEVTYQPIYQLSDLSIVGVESLARWNHPALGCISPDRFIPLAEEIGWIDALGESILRKASSEMVAVFNGMAGIPKPKLSVNLSSRQFARQDFVPRIKQILDETGFPATSLKLEITESVIIDYQERAIEMLHHLRGLGIDVDIDDFGTGYSNLSYLVRLPISTLKIDRSFVSPINEEGANIEIVRTIIALANNLGLKVVAEGIENEAQLDVLRELGCERGQGYLFARPMGINEIRTCLSEQSSHRILPPNAIDEVAVLSTLQ